MTRVGDHYRPSSQSSDRPNDDRGPVYRVVGAPDDVTLLRVTDGSGRRVSTGEIRRVSAEALEAEFEPADDPDAGFSPVHFVKNLLSGLYWSVRRFF